MKWGNINIKSLAKIAYGSKSKGAKRKSAQKAIRALSPQLAKDMKKKYGKK